MMLAPVSTTTSAVDTSKNVEMAPFRTSIVSAVNPACNAKRFRIHFV
jgi:hypothetical protein